MPQAVAEIEQMGAVIARQRLAVLAEIGDVVESGGEAVIFALGDRATAGAFALTEIPGKNQLLVVRDVLVAKQQHGIFVHAGLDIPCLVRSERLTQIDAGNLTEKMRVKLANRHGHGVPPQKS